MRIQLILRCLRLVDDFREKCDVDLLPYKKEIVFVKVNKKIFNEILIWI